MKVNLPVIILVFLVLLALVIFIIARNRKDRRKLEENLLNDYKKPRENEGDIDIEGNESL